MKEMIGQKIHKEWIKGNFQNPKLNIWKPGPSLFTKYMYQKSWLAWQYISFLSNVEFQLLKRFLQYYMHRILLVSYFKTPSCIFGVLWIVEICKYIFFYIMHLRNVCIGIVNSYLPNIFPIKIFQIFTNVDISISKTGTDRDLQFISCQHLNFINSYSARKRLLKQLH